MTKFIMEIKDLANENQGFLAIILFLVSLVIGWISGLFKWIFGKSNRNGIFIQKTDNNQNGEFNIVGNNNVFNIYTKKDTEKINKEVQEIEPSALPADIIVKIKASSEMDSIKKEHEYVKTLKCGDKPEYKWKLITQGLINDKKNKKYFFDVFHLKCLESGEEKEIYFDISDWFGKNDDIKEMLQKYGL